MSKAEHKIFLIAVFSLTIAFFVHFTPAYNAFMLVKRGFFVAFLSLAAFFITQCVMKNWERVKVLLMLWGVLTLSFLFTREEIHNSLLFFSFFSAGIGLAILVSCLSSKYISRLYEAIALFLFITAVYSLYQRYGLGYTNPFLSSSTMGNQNFFAGVLAMGSIIFVHLIFYRKQIVWLLPFLVVLLVMGYMGSRGASLAVVVGVIAYIFFHRALRRYLVYFAVAIILLALIVTPVRYSIRNTFHQLRTGSTGFRVIGWQGMLNIFFNEHRAIAGVGSGAFEIYFPKYRRIDLKRSITFAQNPVYAHNDYIQLLVENGVLGLSMFLLFLVYLFYRVMRLGGEHRITALAVITALLTHSLVSFPLYRPGSGILFWAMAGVVLSSSAGGKSYAFKYPQGTAQKWAQLLLALLLFAFFIYSGILYYRRITGSVLFNVAYHDVDKNPRLAFDSAYRSVRIWPHYYKSFNFLGMAAKKLYQKGGAHAWRYINYAVSAFRQTVGLRPFHSYYRFNLGQSYIFRGQRRKDETLRLHDLHSGIYHLRMALILDPMAHRYYNDLALAYKEAGHYAKAIKLLKHYIKIGADNANPYINLGNIFFNEADMDKAIYWYGLGLKRYPTNAALLYSIGGAYYWKKDYRRAAAYWREYLKYEHNAQLEEFVKRYGK